MLVTRNPSIEITHNLSKDLVQCKIPFSLMNFPNSLPKYTIQTNFEMPIMMNNLVPCKIHHIFIKFLFLDDFLQKEILHGEKMSIHIYAFLFLK